MAAAALTLACALSLGCSDTVSGVVPVGGDQPSEAELERFARRLHLDLTGATASDDYLRGVVDRLVADGNLPSVRTAVVDELLATADYAAAFVEDLENRLFIGETLDGRYQFQCGIVRGNLPECLSCGPAPAGNACGDCACAPLATLDAERTRLLSSAEQLSSGELATSEVERAFASSAIFQSTFAGPNTLASAIFERFLGRPAEGEELANASRMVTGSLLGPQFPAGLLFLRHGSNYADLVDIVFASEAYREAIVSSAFQRLLGRAPSADELVYFVAQLDAQTPDVTLVVRAIAGSRDYFEQ